MAWLYWHNPTRGRGTDWQWWDCSTEPAPAVQANGIAGCCLSHYAVAGPLAPDGPADVHRPCPPVPPDRPARRERADVTDKPPYAVPSVAEIAALAGANGLVAASTFAGCGGSSTGYRWAGWDVRWASEYHPGAADCYAANWPGAIVDRRDVRGVTGAEILEACGVDDLDLLDGSPPCQPFSMAGRREKNWRRGVAHADGTVNAGGSEDLVPEWVRLVREVRPRAAVMENVRGLVIGKAKGYLIEVLRDLRDAGYRASARVLDAQWLGVPQHRERVYVVAVREGVGADPPFPAPLPYRYAMADALPWLGGYEHDTGSPAWSRGRLDPETKPVPPITISGNAAHYHHKVLDRQLRPGFTPGWIDPANRPSSTVLAGGAGQYDVHAPPPPPGDPPPNGPVAPSRTGPGKSYGRGPASPREPAPTITGASPGNDVWVDPPDGDGPSFEGLAIHREWERLRPGESSDRYFNLVRPDPSEPLPTLTASGGFHAGAAAVTHPHQPRKFTILEVRRLMGFPDDYALVGSYTEQWARLGNAVPPPVARAVGLALAEALGAKT